MLRKTVVVPMKLQLDTYKPSEAEIITGVTQATVRNWRRAGYLPRQKGHARYDLAELLIMFATGMMVSRGSTPEAAAENASAVARAIYQSAIWNFSAFAEDVHSRAEDEVGEIFDADVAHFRELMGENFRIESLQTVRRQEIIVKAAQELAGISGSEHPQWFVIWADGTPEFFHEGEDPDDLFFGNIEHDKPYVQGPITIFCLGALAKMVIDRLPRPAILLSGGGS
jgi:hypothetical protein